MCHCQHRRGPITPEQKKVYREIIATACHIDDIQVSAWDKQTDLLRQAHITAALIALYGKRAVFFDCRINQRLIEQADESGNIKEFFKGIFPRPHQPRLPVWIGVGGTPQSFVRAGELGLPLMVAIIGGSFERFRPLVDLYRETGKRAGHSLEKLVVGVHAMGFVGETDTAARDDFFPGWAHLTATIGRERGWSPPTRQQFEAMASPDGAFLIGAPVTVAAKMLRASEMLGGVSRITFQMSTASLRTAAMKRSIELLGTEVAPIVRAAGTNSDAR